jgi:pre-rRNA-processing protein TSR3
LEEIPFHKIKSPHERLRKLSSLFHSSSADLLPSPVPYLVAANPVNYGKRMSVIASFSPSATMLTPLAAYKLTCLEATAAALYITGFDAQAEEILSKFSWGHSFWEVNG